MLRTMRSCGVWLLVLGACGFRSPAGSLDAAVPIDAPAADAATPFCDPADPHLVACYEFEGNTHDGSSHGLHATPTAVTYAGVLMFSACPA